jgi:tetratricopeptide (TPR) repeat protein
MAVEFNVRFETSKEEKQLFLVRILADGSEGREEVDQGIIEALEMECQNLELPHNRDLEKKIGEMLFGMLNGDRQVLVRALRDAYDLGERLRLNVTGDGAARTWPFELLCHDRFLLPSKIDLVRRVEERGKKKILKPSNRPLKVLFITCSPIDVEPVLNFEKEEDLLYRATKDLPFEMDVEDTGSLEGLREKLTHEDFDVIHLSGHAGFNKNNIPVFFMEDEFGYKKEVNALELWKVLKLGKPRLVFLSGCLTGAVSQKKAGYSFAETLIVKGTPAVLGWGLPVTDKGAMETARELYFELSRGKDILEAVNTARNHLFHQESNDWSLLRLVADGKPLDVPIVTSGQKKAKTQREIQYGYLKNSQVKILEAGFIGRRRQIQESLRALKKDDDKFGLLIHGTGGLGKSCLAGKLIDRFKDHELIIVHGEIKSSKFWEAAKDAFIRCEDDKGLKTLDQELDTQYKIRVLCNTVFQKNNYLILLDDFEQNLPNASKGDLSLSPLAIEILEPLLSALPYSCNMTQLIITSRYKFSLTLNNEDLVSKYLQPVLPDSFRGSDLGKKIEELPNINEFPDEAIREQIIEAGRGNPRLLEFLNLLIKESPDTDLDILLKNVANKQEEFLEALMLRQIAASQSPEFNQFLRQASVFFAPVPKEGLEHVCHNIPNWQTHNQTAVRLSLMEATQIADKATEYWLTPMLRQELFNQLPQETQLQCHQSAVKYYLPFINDFENYNPHPSLQLIEHALRSNMPDEAVQAGGPLLNFLRETLAYPEALHYGQAISSIISESTITGDYSDFWGTLGLILNQTGKFEDAIECYKLTLTLAKQVFGERHERVAIYLNNLGEVYRELGKFNKAIDYYEKAYSIFQDLFRTEHPYIATTLSNLGLVYKKLGEYDKAIELYKKALATFKETHRERHPHTAQIINNLGSAYESLGEIQRAIAFYDKALKIDREHYGELHPNVAIHLNNLGLAYNSLGKFQKAIAFYKKALDIDINIYTEFHPKVATRFNNIGLAYYNLNDLKNAIIFYDKALEIDRKIYGCRHPNISREFNNLGLVYNSLGESHKAIEFYEEALDIDREINGDQHPNIATRLNNMGAVYESLDQIPKAIELYKNALDIIQGHFGDKHPYVASTLNNLGGAFFSLGEFPEAIRHYEKSYETFYTIFGANHPDTKKVRNNLKRAKQK